nr:zf-CCHC domain-containing protein/DUF4219 domain-containing protein/UBN2 domain-containing protein [Tanacetum cinerariifolium]
MDSDKYLKGKSMQRPPLFESDHFIYWKNKFETYVKAKDLDLWHIILNGDFPSVAENEVTQIFKVVPFEEQTDDLKKKLAKNNEAKMVHYNALPKKEYEIIFMCKTAKDIWQSLLITHQGNIQVKDNKTDLLVQQYKQFTILEEESIDSGFAIFNTIIASLKALDEGFSSKNYVRRFLSSLHPKWREKVTTIEESKYLSSLALDELIGNLKVHEVVMENDSEIYRGKKERTKSIALKAKKESSDDETSTSRSDNEEYAMAVRNFKKFFRIKGKFVRQPREEKKSFRQRDEKKGKSDRKCFRYGDPNHLISDCPKPPHNKDQKAFIGGSWSDSENNAEDKTTMKLVSWLNRQMSLKIINKNKVLKTKRDLLEKEILELNEKIKKLERSKEIEISCKSCEELKSKNARLKETQVKFVKFDKSTNSLREMLDNQKSSSCKVGLGFDSNEASTSETKPVHFVGSSTEKATDESTIKVHGSTIKVCLRTCLKPDEWIKDSGYSKHITGNKSLFSIYKAYDRGNVVFRSNLKGKIIGEVKESLNVTFDESPPPTKLSSLVDDDVGEEEAIIKNSKLVNNNNEEDESIEVDEIVNIKESKNHPPDQVMENLNHRTLRPDIMFSVCLSARSQENPKTTHLEVVKHIFRYIRGTSHLGLWYPKGTIIETIVYADSNHAGDYVDRKSTSGVCAFMGCCLTSWFAKKQTALAISTTKAEYVSVGKARQQAL